VYDRANFIVDGGATVVVGAIVVGGGATVVVGAIVVGGGATVVVGAIVVVGAPTLDLSTLFGDSLCAFNLPVKTEIFLYINNRRYKTPIL